MCAGGASSATAEELAAEKGSGLHRLGETSLDPVRLVQAFASPDVSTIELRSDRAITSRRPGLDGFCLLGTTLGDHITYAHAIAHDGQPTASKPFAL